MSYMQAGETLGSEQWSSAPLHDRARRWPGEALHRVLVAGRCAQDVEIRQRIDGWRAAYHRRPNGKPVKLNEAQRFDMPSQWRSVASFAVDARELWGGVSRKSEGRRFWDCPACSPLFYSVES